MSLPLTHIEGVPNREDVINGMAHFAGTGPEGTTCGTCKFRGLFRTSRKTNKNYKTMGCFMFKSLTGKHGPVVRKDNRSCKYYDKKQK